MSTVADNNNLPASSTITVEDILPFGVLAVVVCVLVILVLVTALGTCICCMARRRRVIKGGGEESGYWGPEDSDLSDSSSFTGEILREEESTVSDVMDWLEACGQHPGMALAPPTPSIFSQEDFLMEDISEAKRSLKAESPALRENYINHVIDMVDDIQDLSYYRTPRSASTVALHSVDLDSPVLSQGGDTIDLTVAHCGDERALEEGGWLLYSIMREIQNSSKDKLEDEVFNSSKEQMVMNSKLEKRKAIDSSQGKDGLSSKKEVENVLKENSCNGFEQVLVDAKDHRTIIQPLEVKVIVKTVSEN